MAIGIIDPTNPLGVPVTQFGVPVFGQPGGMGFPRIVLRAGSSSGGDRVREELKRDTARARQIAKGAPTASPARGEIGDPRLDGILSGLPAAVVTGAGAGLVFGPPGAIVGGVVGLLMGGDKKPAGAPADRAEAIKRAATARAAAAIGKRADVRVAQARRAQLVARAKSSAEGRMAVSVAKAQEVVRQGAVPAAQGKKSEAMAKQAAIVARDAAAAAKAGAAIAEKCRCPGLREQACRCAKGAQAAASMAARLAPSPFLKRIAEAVRLSADEAAARAGGF